jgi:DNA polymerase II small subunit/DNA polymerase delta subunit B
LKLSKTYSDVRLEAACELALTKVRTPRYHHLKSILAANQDQIYHAQIAKSVKAENDSCAVGYVRGADYYGGSGND